MSEYPPVVLKRRPKRTAKAPPTPTSSESLNISGPAHVMARVRAYCDLHDCTIGSAGAKCFDEWFPPIEALEAALARKAANAAKVGSNGAATDAKWTWKRKVPKRK